MTTVAAAARMARDCRQRVEATSQRTETTQVFVKPDGTATIEQYASPQRARRADGSWSTVDATLTTNADGTLTQKAAAVPVVLSGGGSNELVKVRSDGGEVALSWRGTLPRPNVDGARATYSEVRPGVDLVATTSVSGFSFVLVVKDRVAARDPAVRRLALDSKLTGLRWEGTRAVDSSGRTVLSASAPLMWDSPAPGKLTVDGPADGARRSEVDLTVAAGGQLLVEPDPTLLDDPKATYPLVVDPTIGSHAWTMINQFAPRQSYWSYDRRDCTGGYQTDCAKVGYYTDPVRYRSMFQFATSPWQGKQLRGARFTIDLLHSAGVSGRCENSWTQLQFVQATLHSATNWDNNHGAWQGHLDPRMAVYNSSCGSQRLGSEIPVNLGLLASKVVDGWTVLGLRAEDEGTTAGWKKFDATTARLIVDVNNYPGVPSGITVDNKACATGDGRPYVPTVTATVRANVSDADGDTLDVSFVRQRIRDDGSRGPEHVQVNAGVPAGGTAQVTMPAGVLDPGDEFIGTGDWTRDGTPDVILRDAGGYVYALAGTASRTLRSRVEIGSGLNHDWQPDGAVDWDRDGFLDVVARHIPTGDLWLFPGTESGLTWRVLLGTNWTNYTFAGLGDWDRDGKADAVVVDAVGDLYLYPGNGDRGRLTQARVKLGVDWNGYGFFGMPDWDGDGALDLVVLDSHPQSGQLWLYPGSGARSPLSATRIEIGTGWHGFRARTIGDLTGDGKPDLLASEPGAHHWYLYPGNGSAPVGTKALFASRGTSNNGTYAIRARSSDRKATSGDSASCEFTVDISPPAPATVVADVYKAGTGSCAGGPCGSVGQTGRFTFSSSPDVVSYNWGFRDSPDESATAPSLGAPVTVSWAPTSPGATTLYVDAVDRAGNKSRRLYQFVVAAPTNPVARWMMDDASGSATLKDDTGSGRALTVSGGATLGAPGRLVPGNDGATRTAVRLDGVDDHARRQSLVDTSRSFSVSAWVRLGAKGSGDQTVLAQAGSTHSAFSLRYVGSRDRWVMGGSKEGDPAIWYAAVSTSVPRVGVWTHLVGSYDAENKALRIYVNGVEEGSATGHTGWNATGDLLVGRDVSGDYLNGSVAEVVAWNRLVSAEEVLSRAEALEVGRVGDWHLEEVGSSTSYDSSNFARDLSLRNGAHIPPSGTGLRLDGDDDFAQTDSQVLHTDQSFTVSAWVHPASTAKGQTFVSQRGSGAVAGFYLMFDPANGGQWVFAMKNSATDATGTYAIVRAADLTRRHHLIGVFDAQKQQLRLYVDGELKATAAMNALWRAWDATGPLLIGTSGASGFAHGDIDTVRVFQGVVVDVASLYRGTNLLVTNQRLDAGEDVYSNVGGHTLVMQPDGNLVLRSDGTVRWTSGTQGNPGAYAVLQTDGNFVIYDPAGTALWSTQTSGSSANRLVLENTGTVVLYGLSGQSVWSK